MRPNKANHRRCLLLVLQAVSHFANATAWQAFSTWRQLAQRQRRQRSTLLETFFSAWLACTEEVARLRVPPSPPPPSPLPPFLHLLYSVLMDGRSGGGAHFATAVNREKSGMDTSS